jgi:cytochrome b involved in lipid metabolism
MGLGGNTTSDEGKVEVLLDGYYYDVTNMKHPGGSVIKFYASKGGKEGIDATQAFNQFHIRSVKAQKYLKNLPSRPADMKKVESNMLKGMPPLSSLSSPKYSHPIQPF